MIIIDYQNYSNLYVESNTAYKKLTDEYKGMQ